MERMQEKCWARWKINTNTLSMTWRGLKNVTISSRRSASSQKVIKKKNPHAPENCNYLHLFNPNSLSKHDDGGANFSTMRLNVDPKKT